MCVCVYVCMKNAEPWSWGKRGAHVGMCMCACTHVCVCCSTYLALPCTVLFLLPLYTIFFIQTCCTALTIIYNTLHILSPLTTGTLQLLMTTNPLLYCMTGLTGFLELDIKKLTMRYDMDNQHTVLTHIWCCSTNRLFVICKVGDL